MPAVTDVEGTGAGVFRRAVADTIGQPRQGAPVFGFLRPGSAYDAGGRPSPAVERTPLRLVLPTQILRYVARTGSDLANTCTDPALPCATIQHAVDVAHAGDLIRVAGGTYTRAGTVAAVTRTLAIEGGYSNDFSIHDPERYVTVLDAQRQGSVISATNVSDLWLHHLTLTRGNGTGNCTNGCGGGVYVRDTQLRVGYCVISDNVANASGSGWGQGGGIYAHNGDFVHIWHTRIISNSAARPATTVSEGDGIYVGHGEVRIETSEILRNTGASAQGSGLSMHDLDRLELVSNTIRSNYTTRAGGGLFLGGARDVLISGNVIEENRCDGLTGGGMWLVAVAGKVSRNIVRDNSDARGVDVYGSGPLIFTNNLISGNWHGISILGNSPSGSQALLANNTVVDNGPVGVRAMYTTTLTITNTLVAGHGEGLELREPFSGTASVATSIFWNTSADPIEAIREDPVLDAFYRPMTGSPALDAGTPLSWLAVDLQGCPRPQGGGYDIGAYEGTGPAVFLALILRSVP
ncbi:MAG: right-handed parallel beta-helix repeat-containing protein [Anaerolineae bacterium]